jgi:4-amino-4-deoxy-L-arabinose transferase-like glycosyltransferase
MRAEGRETVTLWCVAAVLAAAIIAYSQTLAFAWDEGFHLLAAQLILRGKKPYLDFLFAQAPLYAYWNAALMRVFGESWRMVHVVSSLAVTGTALLSAQFVLTRLEDRSWRLAGALCAMALVGLNSTILWYGTIGQPYAMCLLLTVVAFRLTVLAEERDSAQLCLAAGACAGAAAASSLLTAPFAPVLLLWTCVYAGGRRFQKCAMFIAGAAVPFLPLLWLFAQSPSQVLFGVFQYHALYRSVDWPDAGKHNVDVATAWMNNYEAVLLIGLAGLGLTYILGRSNWELRKQREFFLCVWLIAAESAYLCIPRPTFGRYYMFVMPFLAMLSAVGLYAIAAQIGSLLLPWRYPLALGLLLSSAFVKYSVDALNEYSWKDLQQDAAKVEEVTPKGAPLYADEHVYFLTKREPPSGMEYMDSHKLDLPDAVAEKMHVLSVAKIDALVAAGKFATISICNNEDRVMALGLPGAYTQTAEVAACDVFWARK